MIKLKTCPACGKPVELEGGQSWHDQHRFLIKCYECGCSRVSDTDKDECVRRWNALPRRLRWTKEPPTEPGWYFCQRICKDAENQYPLRVVHIHYDVVMGKHVLCYGGCAWYGVEDDRQESSPLCDISKSALEEMWWAGPIQEPVE